MKYAPIPTISDPKPTTMYCRYRARNIRDYLAQKGIALDRIDAQGYGELHPVVANDSEQGRKRNRRAELVLLGMEEYTDGVGI